MAISSNGRGWLPRLRKQQEQRLKVGNLEAQMSGLVGAE